MHVCIYIYIYIYIYTLFNAKGCKAGVIREEPTEIQYSDVRMFICVCVHACICVYTHILYNARGVQGRGDQ